MLLRKSILSLIFILLIGYPTMVPAAPVLNSQQDYQNLELLIDVLTLVRDNYVEEISLETLIEGAVRGIFENLDPHSSYLTADMYDDLKVEIQGQFGGIGIELAIRDRELVIVAPIEGTPACRAGILAGDQIVVINGKTTRDLDMMQAVRLLRGEVGEGVELTISRPGMAEPFEVTLVREVVQVQSVRSRLLDNNYGYLRLIQFQERSGEDVAEHLQQLHSQADGGLNGLILDLRNNPGGLLDAAVAVADLFIADGVLVSASGRQPETRQSFPAQADNTQPDYPLVVLINGGSASASEIVAGALQDHQRAVILGEQSFGKGSVQTIIPLPDRAGLRLTTAHYYTPSGRSIQALGITPDILAPQMLLSQQRVPDGMREQDLDKHLPAQAPRTQARPLSQQEEQELQDRNSDYQLQRALDLLKGYQHFNRKKDTAVDHNSLNNVSVQHRVGAPVARVFVAMDGD
ncbi:S41 family peptidase [Pelovirga terrestris]|uniref:S41 family peptidase n=1 Tax=Pelovirga terrestris TaxID=2771352 RepID=A0A8J6QLS2_9BACT|nr:S41 family peptidase [Pelovirga terrestris]MBD1399517.1 S41 family peptidase [Pelovirga terrestris]